MPNSGRRVEAENNTRSEAEKCSNGLRWGWLESVLLCGYGACHTDGIHLNSRGGMIAAELVQKFIDNAVRQR
jgi:hypothetical protein